jgi:endonuclease YncB( thermonuclease family)
VSDEILAVHEKTIEGKVVGVHDGDTATVLDANNNQHKIRFNGIDAPELKMPFGQKSKQNLSDMIFGKQVKVLTSKVDKYGRSVGNIYINGKDVNLEQIRAGFAWHYKKYADEQKPEERISYAAAETAAKAAKLGLWQDENPTPPWDYRGVLKEKQAEERLTRKYFSGAKGGCYYINSSGNKTYVKDKSKCEGAEPAPKVESEKTSAKNSEAKPAAVADPDAEPRINKVPETTAAKPSADGRTYFKGPKGGCYYIDASGKKSYVDREKCEQ